MSTYSISIALISLREIIKLLQLTASFKSGTLSETPWCLAKLRIADTCNYLMASTMGKSGTDLCLTDSYGFIGLYSLLFYRTQWKLECFMRDKHTCNMTSSWPLKLLSRVEVTSWLWTKLLISVMIFSLWICWISSTEPFPLLLK